MSNLDPRPGELATEAVWRICAELHDDHDIQAALCEADAIVAASEYRKSCAHQRRVGIRRRIALALAATLGGIALFTWFSSSRLLFSQNYKTASGEQRTVILPDGSRAILNTKTEISIDYSQDRRVVDLRRGEAVFYVMKNVQKPFLVRSNQGEARAVGTEFAVEASPKSTRITVLEGLVSVRRAQSGAADPLRVIGSNESVTYGVNGSVSGPTRGNTARIIGWQAHRLVISGTTLAAAVEEFNRYSRTPAILSSEGAARRIIYGTFQIGDDAAFLSAVERLLQICVTTTGSGHVIRDCST